MKSKQWLIFIQLVMAFCSNVFADDTIPIDAFTYIPSNDGYKIALFAFLEPMDAEGEFIGVAGTPVIYNLKNSKIDTINTKFSVDYTSDKDAIVWNKTGESILFKNFIASENEVIQWLFEKDKAPDFHYVSQISINKTNDKIAFWMHFGHDHNTHLIIKRGNSEKLDTLVSIVPNYSVAEEMVVLYKIFWFDDYIVAGSVEGSESHPFCILRTIDLRSKVIVSKDTIDFCYYRQFNNEIYFIKNKSLCKKNVIEGKTENIIKDINGEFDISEYGVLFTQNSKLFVCTKSNKRIDIGSNGFSPRWFINKPCILYTTKAQDNKNRTKIIKKCLTLSNDEVKKENILDRDSIHSTKKSCSK